MMCFRQMKRRGYGKRVLWGMGPWLTSSSYSQHAQGLSSIPSSTKRRVEERKGRTKRYMVVETLTWYFVPFLVHIESTYIRNHVAGGTAKIEKMVCLYDTVSNLMGFREMVSSGCMSLLHVSSLLTLLSPFNNPPVPSSILFPWSLDYLSICKSKMSF